MKHTSEIIRDGYNYEAAGNLKKAFEAYKTAAKAGDSEGMFAVGNLYLYEKHWGLPTYTNVLCLPQEYVFCFPTEKAFAWFLKAAKAGNPHAMSHIGVMRFDGVGCKKSERKSRKWLRRAAKAGHPLGIKMLKDLFDEQLQSNLSDADYDTMLCDFCAFVEKEEIENATKCYDVLMNGTDDQLCRLGLQLAIGRYNKTLAYQSFAYPTKRNGRSCAPITLMRRNWQTWLIVNLAAFPDGVATLGFASDITQKLNPVAGASVIGEAVYHATDFGWLRGQRNARLLKVNSWNQSEIDHNLEQMVWCGCDLESYQKIVKEFKLEPKEAVFAERGEKEFSVEIVYVENDSAHIIQRYTVDGADQGGRQVARVSDFRFE